MCSPQKSHENSSISKFYGPKQNVAFTRLEVPQEYSSALQVPSVQRQTDLLLCTVNLLPSVSNGQKHGRWLSNLCIILSM